MVSQENGWEKVEDSQFHDDLGIKCNHQVTIHRKELPEGWLVLVTHVFDRRAMLGRFDLSTRLGRLFSIKPESNTLYIPDPEKRWRPNSA
jgi:hypothetical protein